MARTKQTARQSTGGKVPPPPPPAPPPLAPPPPSGESEGQMDLLSTKMTYKKVSGGKGATRNQFETREEEGKNMLSNILSPSILLRQKEHLKNYNDEQTELDRDTLLDGQTNNSSLPLVSTLEIMRTQSHTAMPVTVLNLSGTDQLTDMFWFMVKQWRISMPRLTRISLNGCYNLTNAGIRWMVKAFPRCQYVELCGIKNLTEESLMYIISHWEEFLVQVNVSGTSIGMIPPGYQGSVKLNGCPLVSPTEKLYRATSVKMSDKMNRSTTEWNSFKVVIITDGTVPWSPFALFTGEKDIKARKHLSTKTNLTVGKSTQINLFEMPVDSGFVDMFVSRGSIVIIPYLLAEDGPDPDYPDDICKNIFRVFTRCHDCVFVLLGLTADTGPGVKEVAARYFNLVTNQIDRKVRDLSRELNFSIEKKVLLGRMFFFSQQMFAHGEQLKHCLEKMVKPEVDRSQPNIVDPPAQTISSMMNIEGDNKVAFEKMIESATNALKFHFPWYFIPYQIDLQNALGTIEKNVLPLTTLKEIADSMNTPSSGFTNFSSHANLTPFVGKMLEYLDRMGKFLYYPDLGEGYAMSDYTSLERIYDKLLNSKAPHKATWRFLGSNIPCWTKSDIAGICPQSEMVSVMTELLLDRSVFLCLPRDVWTTELEDAFAYVLVRDLPYYPAVDVENLWPDGLPSDEVQVERYYSFMPGVPDAYFPMVLRQCLELGGVRLMWNKGIVIQKGPVTVLLEMLNNYENTPMLFLGIRMASDGTQAVNEDQMSSTRWGVFRVYRNIVKACILNLKIYALETIPCTKCHPPKNRYKTVNARNSEIWLMNEQLLASYKTTGRNISCRNDGSDINLSAVVMPQFELVPVHYYLGCLPSFSAYNRCMFCQNCAFAGACCEGNLQNGKTSWNCSCEREGQMCGDCGMCQRCVTILARNDGMVKPCFQKKGSSVSLQGSATDDGGGKKVVQQSYTCEQELTPNYSPVVVLNFVRGTMIKLNIKMGSTELIYDTGEGSVSEMIGTKTLNSKSDEGWKCREGFTITVEVKFSKEDLDEMDVIFRQNGVTFYEYKTSAQSCIVTVVPSLPLSLVVYMPRVKQILPQEIDDFGEKGMCSYKPGSSVVPSSIEATLLQGKQYIENALFQAGGVNYSGSSYIMLPVNLSPDLLQYPTFNAFKQPLAFHLLCYTRSIISNVLSFGAGQAVPESWSVYRMIHLADHEGMVIENSRQQRMFDKAGELLWGWIFMFKNLPKVELPKNVSKFLTKEVIENLSPSKIEAGLQDLLDISYWNLIQRLNITNLLSFFEDTYKLLTHAQVLQNLTTANKEEIGLTGVVSKFNEENILYLCPGHNASMKFEEGITKVLPEIYGNYASFLLSVDMPSNQLTEIPENTFKALPNLAEFDCSNNFIEKLPDSIGSCKKLYSLTLSENNLTDLPDSLKECSDLFRLDITSNMMEAIPAVVTKLKQLQRLYASNMFLTALPEDIGALENLEKLYVNGNCFTSVPKSFANLKSLNDLGMSGVPWLHISKSKKVMSYDNFVDKLNVWRLDRWLEEHKEEKEKIFRFFDEDGNGVLDNEEMGKLNAALFNMFPRFGYKGQEPPEDDTPSGFPMEILECRSLEYLNMYYQGLVSVPAEIGNLQDLKILNVSHNPNLLSIPAEIGTISSLTRLEMEECPLLKTPPKEIRAKGFSTTFAYLRRLMSGSMPCKRTKLMLVGLGGAGKTSLVHSLLSKDGKASLSHGEAITDGIDICTWTVKAGDEHITYSVWDFAGQTVYYNTHQFFLSNRAVYLLLWNVRLGFEHAGLDFWLSSISVQAPKAPIFVVGSHIDQVSKYELPINEMRERYKQIAGFHFVSSFTGQGIKELQENLFDVTLQQQYMGEQIPEVWLTFENNAIECRSSSNVIEYTALEKLANISGIFDMSEVYQAVQFLHDLGSLQHFTTESLKSKVVVNPQWIVDVMACVVSVKNSPIKEGRLQHKDISTVWKDYPADLHDWLLKLTEEYDLTFRLEHEPVNLVPCLLPEKAPEFTWQDIDKDSDLKENKMIYKFEYLPAGLFNRGQVRLHQISDSALIWKRGSFLKKNGHVALLQQTRDSELIVQVQGPRPENVIFLVHEVFEGLISESFRGVTYDYLIPCPDCLRMVLKDPHMFKASTIRRAMELKAPFLQCIKYFHTISCMDLLACMPPDNHSDFDVHLVQSVRSLRDLRKDLAADIFMSYCGKDAPASRSSVIHPATVCDDLQAVGYKCWFPEPGKTYSIEEMARALTDASVFIAFVSNDYAKDEDCVNIFKYARLTLRKPMVVVAVGNGFEWKQSRLGILLSDEVYVMMTKSKVEVYKSKLDELLKTISSKTNKQIGVNPTPTCFFSYAWVNSANAVKLGTRSVKGAIGYGDPRGIKDYLEENGVKCWIDVERVGQNGLFDDIAEGLLSARLVIACVSDEYANSATSRMEFRYAANTLKVPIVLAVVGTGNNWRASETGVLSLRFPIVSFQEKSETAYSNLLSLVKEHLSKGDTETEMDRKNKRNKEHKNLSFQELFELAQRKLLRQLCFYAEHQDVDIYPRLFIVDFLKKNDIQEETEGKEKEHSDEEQNLNEKSETKETKLKGEHTKELPKRQLSKTKSEMKSVFKMQKYCVHTLCEHDEGWHSVAEPIHLPHDFGEALLDKFCPLISRMTAVMKYNKHFTFNCMQNEFGEDYITWLEENPQATMSDYQQIYHEFRQMVVDADSHRSMGKLARCRLANGKTIWLCEKHRKSMKVTILSSEVTSNRSTEAAIADNMYMVVGLRSGQHADFNIKFTSSRTAKRRKDNLQESRKEEGKSDMYSTYELLPDKKMPTPAVMKKKQSKKSVVGETKGKMAHSEEEELDSFAEKQVDKDTSAETETEYVGKQESAATKIMEKGDILQETPEEPLVKKSSKTVDDTKQNVSDEHMNNDTQEAMNKSPRKQRKGTEKASEEREETAEKLKENQQPQMVTKAKTFYGKPGKKEELVENVEKERVRPTMSRSKTTVEKPKSKACNLM